MDYFVRFARLVLILATQITVFKTRLYRKTFSRAFEVEDVPK